ncbi:MAG TPA: hypothetical protein VFJ82_14200 [Longimicrobium sp.]|nr:hypothetical protein [Longimicrobium sp.]
MPQRHPRPNEPEDTRGRSSLTPSRAERRAQVRALPTSLKVARIAELLFFPVIGFMLLGLPVPSGANAAEIAATLTLAAEAVAAVAVAVGLGQRRRWAWVLAVLLAAWVIAGIVLRGGRIVHAALSTPGNVLWFSTALLAWTLLTQLFALAGCLATRNWRDELR